MNRKFHLKNGPALVAGSLIVGMALAVGGTVLATSIGTNLSVDGTATITGASTFTGAITANGSATLGDAAADTLTVNATTSVANNGGVDGSFYIGDAAADILTVTATTTVQNGITFNGGVSMAGAGGASITNALNVAGNTTLGDASTDTLTLNASTTVANDGGVNGNFYIGNASGDALTVTATTTFQTGATFSGVGLAITGAGDLSVADDVTISGGLGIGVATTTNSNLQVAGDLQVTGAMSVTGAFSFAASTSFANLGSTGNSFFGDAAADILTISATTTVQNGITFNGTTVFGDAAGDLVAFTAANLVYNNAGTTTIPSANAAAWAIATSSANIPFVRYDTSNYRIGIGTTTPGATLAVGGDIYSSGYLSVGGISTLTGAVTTGAALTAGTDLTVTSGARVGTGDTGTHLTALADDSLLIEGESEFNGIAWFDGSLRASSTLLVTGATTHIGTTKVGESGTALTQVLTGYVDCGPIVDAQSIAATSTGTIGCTNGFSNVSANDAVFLTATTTSATLVNGTVIYTGKASTTAANRVQAEVYNLTGAAWTVTTSTWRYLIIR